MNGNRLCVCGWPRALSVGCCSICGATTLASDAAAGRPWNSFRQQLADAVPLSRRSLPHLICLGLLILGWLVLPFGLILLLLVLAGGYFCSVALSTCSRIRYIDDPGLKENRLGETVLFSVLAFILLSFAGMAGVGALIVGNSAHTTRASTTTLPVPQPQESPEQVQMRKQGERTLEYWTQFKTTMSALSESGQSPQRSLELLATAIDKLERMPASGVDVEAVEFIFATTEWMRTLYQFKQRTNDPSLFVEAFLRGAAGDFLGPTLELNEAQQTIREQFERLQSREKRVQALISARYQISLP